MSTWKKIIVSGSGAHLSSVTASNGSIISGSLTMSGSITNVDNIDFNMTSSAANAAGRLVWDDGNGSLYLGLKGGNVNLLLGQQTYARIFNAEATTLNKGEVVYISGSQGNRIAAKRADYIGEAGSATTIGFVAESIASGAEGFIITNGVLEKLNTVGLTTGTLLYLSSSGQYSQTKPIAPQHTVTLGYVERVHATVGSIYVKIDNGYELNELHNVLTNGATYGDLLFYSASLWTHTKQLSGSYGVTGSLQATSFTGSLQGSASYALQSLSSSYSITASFASSSPAVYDFGSFATPTDVGGGGNFGILTDGDKGDITVTSSGSIWTIDNDVVTYDKIQNVTTSSVLLGRATTGAGNIEEISLGSGLTLAGTTLSAAGGGGSSPQMQVDTFTSSGTWTKPAWAKKVSVFCMSGGSGGGSGRRGATTTARAGGGGGAGNTFAVLIGEASGFTSTVSVTVGAGGTGGASVTTDSTNGNTGGTGGASSFGTYIATVALPGAQGGTTSGGGGASANSSNIGIYPSNEMIGRSGDAAAALSRYNSFQILGSLGATGGSGQAANVTTTTAGTEHKPTNYVTCFPTWTFGTPGADGGNGGNGSNNVLGYLQYGTAGGGGSYKTGQATGAGGNGGYGAGGGGGAASDNGFASGAGGNGGGGLVIVVTEG